MVKSQGKNWHYQKNRNDSIRKAEIDASRELGGGTACGVSWLKKSANLTFLLCVCSFVCLFVWFLPPFSLLLFTFQELIAFPGHAVEKYDGVTVWTWKHDAVKIKKEQKQARQC